MNEDFFSGIERIEFFHRGIKAKMPVFWQKARGFVGIYPVPLHKLLRLIPDNRFTPAQLLPGIGAVQLVVAEYFEMDLGPYREAVVAVPLNAPHFQPVPGYNLVRQMLQMVFFPYMLHVPVTTEAALTGIDYWGYPKFLASIEFSDTGDWVACEVKENEDLIFRIKGRKVPARRSGLIRYFNHLFMNQQMQQAEVKMNAKSYALSFKPSDAELELGSSHEIALQLSDLLLYDKPLVYLYVPDFQLIHFELNHRPLPLLKSCLETGMGLSLDKIKKKEPR